MQEATVSPRLPHREVKKKKSKKPNDVMNAHQFSALAALQGKQTSQQCSLVGEADKPAQQQCSGCGHFCISLPRDASAAIPGAQSDFPPHDVAAVFMSPGFRAALLRARAQRKFYFCKEKKKERERGKKKNKAEPTRVLPHRLCLQAAGFSRRSVARVQRPQSFPEGTEFAALSPGEGAAVRSHCRKFPQPFRSCGEHPAPQRSTGRT